MPQQPYILAEGLAYGFPPDAMLFHDVQASLFRGDRIALVGANGVGKSSLLQILAGHLPPSAGLVQRRRPLYYLPQISTLRPGRMAMRTPEESVLSFLSGQSEDWWTIPQVLETQFDTVLDLDLPIAQLSGGELTKLFLATGLAQEPQVLLLDEPTNHMDFQALEDLRRFLQGFEGAFVIVSHKPFFLDQVVDAIWELTPNGLTRYGGNYSLYRQQKQTEREAQQRSHELARKHLKQAKASALQEQQRAARSQRQGRLRADSMPKIVAGAYQRKAEITAGKLKQSHGAAIAAATQQVAQTKVHTTKAATIQLEERSHKRRNLIEIQGADLWVGDRPLLWGVHLHLMAGDRVAIAGANGSGKSSLVKALWQPDDTQTRLVSGQVFQASDLKAVYLDQTYQRVQRDVTVLENLQRANPQLDYQRLRQQLGHFLFFNEAVDKSASVLSGGELARLALAIISVSDVDLVILDEPTNNLDMVTVDHMIEALNDYPGALLVISHDLDFLSRIQITQAFHIQDQTLHRTSCLPQASASYYSAIAVPAPVR